MVFGMLAAAAVGAGASGSAQSVFSYNREAWETDIFLDQTRRYQRQNLLMTKAGQFREDIRDLSGAAITIQGNYVLVSTLFLGFIADQYVNGGLPDTASEYLKAVYNLCVGCTILYFVLAMICSVAAVNLATNCQRDLLTQLVRVPCDEMFAEIDQWEKVECIEAFEHSGVDRMFRIPGWSRMRSNVPVPDLSDAKSGRSMLESWRSSDFANSCETRASPPVGIGGIPLADLPAQMESNFVAKKAARHFEMYQAREREWEVLGNFAYVFNALGANHILSAWGYFSASRWYTGDYWSSGCVQVLLFSMNVLVARIALRRLPSRWMGWAVAALNIGAPACAMVPIRCKNLYVEAVFVPMCIGCHTLWVMMVHLYLRQIALRAAEPLADDVAPGACEPGGSATMTAVAAAQANAIACAEAVDQEEEYRGRKLINPRSASASARMQPFLDPWPRIAAQTPLPLTPVAPAPAVLTPYGPPTPYRPGPPLREFGATPTCGNEVAAAAASCGGGLAAAVRPGCSSSVFNRPQGGGRTPSVSTRQTPSVRSLNTSTLNPSILQNGSLLIPETIRENCGSVHSASTTASLASSGRHRDLAPAAGPPRARERSPTPPRSRPGFWRRLPVVSRRDPDDERWWRRGRRPSGLKGELRQTLKIIFIGSAFVVIGWMSTFSWALYFALRPFRSDILRPVDGPSVALFHDGMLDGMLPGQWGDRPGGEGRLEALAAALAALGGGAGDAAQEAAVTSVLAVGSEELDATWTVAPPLGQPTELDVHWPSPHFQPHTIACGSAGDEQQCFAANDFLVVSFSAVAAAVARPVPCHPPGRILDVAAECLGGRCRPWLLIEGAEGSSARSVVECLSGDTSEQTLPRRQVAPQLLAMAAAGGSEGPVLLALEGSHVLQLQRQPITAGAAAGQLGTWAPLWSIAEARGPLVALHSLPGASGRLLSLAASGRLVLQDANSGATCASQVPAEVLAPGGALLSGAWVEGHAEEQASLLVLARPPAKRDFAASASTPSVHLLRIPAAAFLAACTDAAVPATTTAVASQRLRG